MKEWESPSFRAAMRDSGRGHLIGEGPSFALCGLLRSDACERDRHGQCYGSARVRDRYDEDGYSDERCQCDCHAKKREQPA